MRMRHILTVISCAFLILGTISLEAKKKGPKPTTFLSFSLGISQDAIIQSLGEPTEKKDNQIIYKVDPKDIISGYSVTYSFDSSGLTGIIVLMSGPPGISASLPSGAFTCDKMIKIAEDVFNSQMTKKGNESNLEKSAATWESSAATGSILWIRLTEADKIGHIMISLGKKKSSIP